MKKAVFEKYGDLDVIKIIDTPKPVATKNEVIIKVKSVGLNPKDILVRKGKFKRLSGKKFPQTIAYECSGIIEDPNGSRFKKGDKVFGMVNGMKGRCCSEYVRININEIAKAAKNLSYDELAGIPLAAQTALQAIRDLGKLQKDQHICINGASGGVGTLAIQIAKELGGKITTISSRKNVDFCMNLGADQAIAYDETDILKTEQKFDVFFDVFGNYSFQKTAHLLQPKGIYVTTVPKLEIIKEQFFNLFRRKKAKLVVVKSNTKDLQWLAQGLEKGAIKPIVDKVFPMEEIKEAQAYIMTKRAKGKVIIQVESPSNSNETNSNEESVEEMEKEEKKVIVHEKPSPNLKQFFKKTPSAELFEGILIYSNIYEYSVLKEGPKKSIIKLFVKDSWVKYQKEDLDGKIIYQAIYNPETMLVYDVSDVSENIIVSKFEDATSIDLKEFPFRREYEDRTLYGQRGVISDDNYSVEHESYWMDGLNINVKYEAPFLANVLFSKEQEKTLVVHSKYDSNFMKEHNLKDTHDVILIDIKQMALPKSEFEIDTDKLEKYRMVSDKQYEREENLASDGIHKFRAIAYLEKLYQRELTEKEKQLALKTLLEIFDKDPKKKEELIAEIKERERAADEELKARNKKMISILEREFNRKLTEEEKTQPTTLYVKYMQDNPSKAVLLGKELLLSLKSDE